MTSVRGVMMASASLSPKSKMLSTYSCCSGSISPLSELDLFFRIDLVLVGDVVAQKLHHAVGDGVEQPHDGIRDAVEPHERPCREQRIAFGGEDGERLGDELAYHDVQGRDDDEADGHRNGGNGRVRQPQGSKRRMDERGNRRFAQPAQGQRRQRDAQLAGGQVGVHVVGDQLGVLGARLAFVDRHFHLRLAHAHQGEFGHDEERVHEQEEQHQKQTEGYGHNCGWSSLI